MSSQCACKKFNFEKMRYECFKEVKQQNGGKQIMFSSDLKNDIDRYMIEAHKKMHYNKKVTKNTADQHYNALSKLLTTKMNKLFSIKSVGKITGGDASKIL
tara:strand:+ start:1518 stop:1820 length:303 start_codon:yes stop_codon:yes gene_type:complete